jgi:hypothetical protein
MVADGISTPQLSNNKVRVQIGSTPRPQAMRAVAIAPMIVVCGQVVGRADDISNEGEDMH